VTHANIRAESHATSFEPGGFASTAKTSGLSKLRPEKDKGALVPWPHFSDANNM
jgi:hypothetical protein